MFRTRRWEGNMFVTLSGLVYDDQGYVVARRFIRDGQCYEHNIYKSHYTAEEILYLEENAIIDYKSYQMKQDNSHGEYCHCRKCCEKHAIRAGKKRYNV